MQVRACGRACRLPVEWNVLVEFVLVFVLATCDGGDNGCKKENDECCIELDASNPEVSVVPCALFDAVANCRLGIPPIAVRVDVEYTEGAENPLQVHGCSAVIWDRFGSSSSYSRAADFPAYHRVSREYSSPAVSASSRRSILDLVRLFVFDCMFLVCGVAAWPYFHMRYQIHTFNGTVSVIGNSLFLASDPRM